MSDVVSLVQKRVEADPKLSDDGKLLILAALEGDEALADMAGFVETTRDADAGTSPPVEPAGAYLQRITVQGFRGIGPAATLDLRPGPGLTVIAGRNGSGKSSFAEALEVALTGTTYRWKNKGSKQWQEAWRNLHHPDSPQITVTLAEEAIGATTIVVDWPDGAGLAELRTTLQRQGEKKECRLDSLGWTAPLDTYRPMLSYDELGALFAGGPSQLYEAWAAVLGLEQITDAIKRLDERSRALAEPGRELRRLKSELTDLLSGLDDDRATEAGALLRARQVDVASLRRLASGVGAPVDATTQALRAIEQLALPDPAVVDQVARRLRAAVAGVADQTTATTAALRRRSAIIEAALAVHEHDGDTTCPVCGQGRLDDDRAATLQRESDELRRVLHESGVALDELEQARAAASAVCTPVPRVLEQDPVDGIADEQAAAQVAWADWAAPLHDDTDLAARLTSRLGPLRAAVAALQEAARPLLTTRNDVWADAARRLSICCEALDEWNATKQAADTAKAATTWLKRNDLELKNERIRPIADQAAEIWSTLRQESNVDIAGISLEGTSTRRRVEIAATVDGDSAPNGLSVLSQGELHALALAMFLPRATLAESPFRFVVLDDPVQAMDPAKVDGLVTVLSTIARVRQVVVFSHDDRLAAAVRRAPVPATILEVTRESESTVAVRESYDPARQLLADAMAMTHDDGLPEGTFRRALPGLLRLAVEAAARDRYFASRLGAGARHADVAEAWDGAHRTRAKISLAVYGEVQALDGWLSRHNYRNQALGVCGPGAHEGLKGDPTNACDVVRRTIDDIAAGTK